MEKCPSGLIKESRSTVSEGKDDTPGTSFPMLGATSSPAESVGQRPFSLCHGSTEGSTSARRYSLELKREGISASEWTDGNNNGAVIGDDNTFALLVKPSTADDGGQMP